MKQRKIPMTLKHEEVLKLFEKARNIKDKMILKTLYYCGLRVSELINLKLEDLDFKERRLKVVQGKGSKDRYNIMPKTLSNELSQYIKLLNKKPESFIFNSPLKDGRPITRDTVQKMIKKINIKISPHVLRHSYATHIYNKTGDIKAVKDLLGHVNISTTDIYTHISTEKKKSIVDDVF